MRYVHIKLYNVYKERSPTNYHYNTCIWKVNRLNIVLNLRYSLIDAYLCVTFQRIIMKKTLIHIVVWY